MPDWKVLWDNLQIERVVQQDIQFKGQLEIGDEVYHLLRYGRAVDYVANFSVAGTAGSAVAASSVVAGTFFPAGGILGLIGLGTAVTPIGWIIAAGVLSGSVWVASKKLLERSVPGPTKAVPDWLNSPLDFVATGMFDTMGPLALKIANADREIDDREMETISTQWFVRTWGYHPEFVRAGLRYYVDCIDEFDGGYIAQRLVDFLKDLDKKGDCNAAKVLEKITRFLRELDQMNHGDGQGNSAVFRNLEEILQVRP